MKDFIKPFRDKEFLKEGEVVQILLFHFYAGVGRRKKKVSNQQFYFSEDISAQHCYSYSFCVLAQ